MFVPALNCGQKCWRRSSPPGDSTRIFYGRGSIQLSGCEPGETSMSILRRGGARGFVALLTLLLGVAAALPAAAAEKPRIQVDNYQIDAQLLPRAHRLIAHAVVKFTALDDITAATFELHNALRPTRVTDDKGTVLSAERISQDSTVRVSLPNGLAKGASSTLNFDYEGTLSSADDSPVQGLKLAYIG